MLNLRIQVARIKSPSYDNPSEKMSRLLVYAKSAWHFASDAFISHYRSIDVKRTWERAFSRKEGIPLRRTGRLRSVSRRWDVNFLFEKRAADPERRRERVHRGGGGGGHAISLACLRSRFVIRTRREYLRAAAGRHSRDRASPREKRGGWLACLISVRNRVRDCAPAGQTRSIKSRRN